MVIPYNIIGATILAVIVICFIFYYMFVSREGFQTTPTPKKTELPDTCLMMKVVLERLKQKADEAERSGIDTSIKQAHLIIKNVQAEMDKLNCP